MRRLAAPALALGLALVAAPSRADTPLSMWDSAKDPEARARWDLHVRAREQMDQESGRRGQVVARELALGRARAMLEAGKAAESPDVRLRFDLGEVYEQLERHDLAVSVLDKALDLAPDHPAAAAAWVTLAYAGAKLDRPDTERRAYLRYLELVTDERPRSTALLNLAEAEMRLGHLATAVAGYQDSLRASASLGIFGQETYTLSLWGLAVALDRSGDPVSARAEATRALSHDPGMQLIGFGPNVFFVPAYERLWYLGLGHMAAGEAAADPRQARDEWSAAVRTWEDYVKRADAKERWLPLARAHLARARERKKAADARAARAPMPEGGDPEAPTP